VSAISVALAVVLVAASAGGAALIVAPAPSKSLALLAVVASEKSLLVAATAVVGLALALAGLRGAARVGVGALAAAALAIGLLPAAQAARLARARGVALDVGRYLRAAIDTEGPGRPDRTVACATVDDGRVLSLDVYLPARGATRPGRGVAVLVVHGGFWSAGARGDAPLSSRRLADLGFTVFDVEYRTSPQPNWQTATADVKQAVGWVKAHAATGDWTIDPARVVLLGRSAGAHLALIAAYTASAPDLPSGGAVGDTSVDAVVSLYGPTDLTWAYDHPANPRAADSPARLRDFLGGPPAAAAERYCALSPVERVTAAAPRTLLVQGGRDQFVDPRHADRLAARLRAAGVAHDRLLIPYAQHAFDYVVGGFSTQLLEAAMLRLVAAAGPP
jgi:acetyl esterase/lipase